MPTWETMRAFAIHVCVCCLAMANCATARAQAATESPAPALGTSQLELLTKKIDEQNAKIDALSQHLLKIEQQLSKPGVMIEEPTPIPGRILLRRLIRRAPTTQQSYRCAWGNTHFDRENAKVSVEALQKFNHIENDRKLQIGQVIQIPASVLRRRLPSTSPTPSPSTAATDGNPVQSAMVSAEARGRHHFRTALL